MLRGLSLLAVALLGATWAIPASGQLLIDRLFNPTSPANLEIVSVRLFGMGGFTVSVRDENRQINLWDYSRNPAGFGDDRDSWSAEVLYDHNESNLNSEFFEGDDLRRNDIGLLFGYYRPKRMGLGGFIGYAKAQAQTFPAQKTTAEVSGFGLVGNAYPLKTVSLGVMYSFRGSDNDALSRSIYDIAHQGDKHRATGAASWMPVRGIALAGQLEYVGITRTGESVSSVHNDVFEWKQNGLQYSLEGFVDRGRLQGAVTYRSQNLDGREDATLSWSERFNFNPTNDPHKETTTTFDETRGADEFRTRWNLDVVPGIANIGVEYVDTSGEVEVNTNPNRIGSLGSLPARRQDLDGWEVAVGGSFVTAGRRLLLAAEWTGGSSKLAEAAEIGEFSVKKDEWLIRGGSEYLLGETIAGRLGVIYRVEDWVTTELGAFTYDATTLAAGIGVVPSGGIWQFDLAYQFDLRDNVKVDATQPDGSVASTDIPIDTNRSRFAAMVRYLF